MNTYGFTKKIALVGTGFVGMSFAYAMLCESVCDELVLIDVNKQKLKEKPWILITVYPLLKQI